MNFQDWYPYLIAGVASAAAAATYIWQDSVLPSNDGTRYTSCKPQPTPFHRRFHHWPERVLQVTSIVSLVAVGALMGDWKKALLLMVLPGAWFTFCHPTTVDGPSMLLALLCAKLLPTHPWIAIPLSLLAGAIHERAPVFAALYSFSPWPLLGLLAVQWWNKPAKPDHDKLVGHGFVDVLKAHRPYVDFLDGRFAFFSMGLVPLMSVYYGLTWRGALAYAVAWGSRAIGTDGARFMFWSGPALVSALPENVPPWAVLVHCLLFRRMI